MAQGENKEIEILLRGLARRAGADIRRRDDSGSAAQDSRLPSGAHLDADEASSYAEGRLPAPARARYTAHIADCADCRSVVALLANALGPISKQPDDVPAMVTASWLQKLAALFTPTVMRYAMPAVALIAAVVLALFLWRHQSPSVGEMVATRMPNENAAAVPTPIHTDTAATAQVAENKPAAREEPHVSSPKSETGKVEDKSIEDKKVPVAAPVVPAAEEKAAARKDEGEPAVRPVTSTKAAAAAAPPAEPTDKLSKEQQAKNAEQPAGDVDNYQIQKREAQKTNVNDATARQRGPSANATNQIAQRKAKVPAGDQARGGGGDSVGRARRSENESDTRSVAGRRFRREGNAWVDTEYDQGQTTVNVTRGSEQYRALVADEPEIGRIAEQLSGEVIVVWKSRAYRIH